MLGSQLKALVLVKSLQRKFTLISLSISTPYGQGATQARSTPQCSGSQAAPNFARSAFDGPLQALDQRLQGSAGEHELVTLQNAVHVGALLRQHVHPRQVARRQPQSLPAAQTHSRVIHALSRPSFGGTLRVGLMVCLGRHTSCTTMPAPRSADRRSTCSFQ